MRTHFIGLLLTALVLTVGISIVVVSGCRDRESRQTAAAQVSATAVASVAPNLSAAVEPSKAMPEVSAQVEPAPEAEAESPIPEIPSGRSKPPTVQEWQAAEELNTQEPHSQADNCQMKVVREWLKVYCHGDITGYSEQSGFGEKTRDYFISMRKGKSADFVVRLRKGKTLKVKVQRNDAREAVLYASWPHDKDTPQHIALGRGKMPEESSKTKKKKDK
jgi:hypothetical protein